MPTAALLAGLLTYLGILSSLKTIVHLRELYEQHFRAKSSADPSSKLYPDIHGPYHLPGCAWSSSDRMVIAGGTRLLIIPVAEMPIQLHSE